MEPYAASHGEVYRVRSVDTIDPEPEFGRFIDGHASEAVVPGNAWS